MRRSAVLDRGRALLRAGLGAALAVAAAAGGVVAQPTPAAAAPVVRWVDVSVATLWSAPGTARPVDAPALAEPADPRRWVGTMSDAQKRWLSLGRTQTQVLYGTRVRVVATRGGWTKVVVPSQPSPRDSRGYPGWLPARQLTTAAPTPSASTAVVSRGTAWLWADDDSVGTRSGRVMELSYGTRLPVVSTGPGVVHVGMLGGSAVRTLRRSAVVLRSGPEAPPTAAAVVDEALQFLGLPYLWSGTSGFGFDCSGLTYAAYRQLGVSLPRDAAPQATGGIPVARRDLAPGDLVFLQTPAGVVHHVAMYVGLVGGVRTVVEAPHTGASVRLTPLSKLGPGYAGARRYLVP